jgi:hypothetical protein
VNRRIFFPILFLFILILCPFVHSLAEERTPFSLDDIGNLMRSNVSKKKVLMTIEEHGVKFLKTKVNIDKLEKMGADELILAAIEKEWKKDGRVLIVETVPGGATIHLDGERVGETPIEIEGLKPKKYSVRVEMEGYEHVDHEIALTEGIGRKLTISLVKSEKGTPSPPPPPVPTPTPTPSPSPTPTPAPMETPPSMCSLFINTQPAGAKIYVNGRHLGTSPKYIELPPGEHSIVMVKEFYKPTERKVVVREGETDLPPIDQRLVPTR